MPVLTDRAGDIAVVTLDNPPVNAIGREVRQGLLDAVRWVAGERGLDRVILRAAGRVFAAGADAREFDAPPAEPHLPDIVAAIETSDVPWIAAIQGAALGGGLELCLACRYRIARADAVLGLPEVTLGVVPGAGGTQRLPRLTGPGRALDLIATGRTVTGAEAQAMGLVQELDDDPAGYAEMVNSEWLGMAVPAGDLNAGELDSDAIEAARARADRKMRGQAAPLRAIELVVAATRLPLAEGLAAERAAFLELRGSDEARALRHVFFAERAARAPREIAEAGSSDIGRVAVVGGGTMGSGIAYACLDAGLSVTLVEADAEGAARATGNVERIVAGAEARGLIDPAGAAERRARLTVSADFDAVADAGLAVEAAFEAMEVKQRAFAALDAAMPRGAVLATNTSYLDIDEIAAGTRDPSRVVGLHFFAPAHVMKLLEIVQGAASSPRALATGFALARRLGKVPVVAGVCDGFIGNRILARTREAADTLLLQGATPWEVDEAMVDFGYPMGPYEAQDLSGLDLAHANRRRQDATRDPARRYVAIADRMVAEGRLGRKSGVGWYRYPGGGGKVVDPLIEDLIVEEARFAQVTRRIFDADEIRHRLVLAMINEAAGILDEGIARSAADIDLVTVHGYGFPRWRGGLMHHADTLGPARILEALTELCRDDPVAWRPSPLIERLARSGGRFADATPSGTGAWRGSTPGVSFR